jgi:hypothetical protein
MRVISLGWGVQSFTLAAMAALGDIPPVDAAIHADTTHERSATYAFAERWTPWLETRGVRVVTVQPAQNKLEQFETRFVYIPAHTTDGNSKGQLRRQCTGDWKVDPIRRWLQANRNRQQVSLLMGISLDEWHRAKDSPVKYVAHEFPLLDHKMTRNDCGNYLTRHELEAPGKSACTFCPYQSKREWRHTKDNPQDWAQAVAVDEAIRKRRPPFNVYVHSACIPLVDVDLSTPEDHGQLRLLDDTPCDSGYCFL